MNIEVFTKVPSNTVREQVLSMVRDYHTDLSMMALPPSNCLHDFYNWVLVQEVDGYITRIGLSKDIPVELAVAFDELDPAKVIGFVLYLPVASHPEACAISYMAVASPYRRRGIGAALIATVVERFPHTELTCFVPKVPFYEKNGFKVLNVRNTQVVMNTRERSTDGLIRVINADGIAASHGAKALHDKLLARFGKKAMLDSHKKLTRLVDRLSSQAADYLKSRTAG